MYQVHKPSRSLGLKQTDVPSWSPKAQQQQPLIIEQIGQLRPEISQEGATVKNKIRSNFEMLRSCEEQLWRLAELRALLEDLGEDPDAALEDLLIDERGQEAQA